MIMELVKNRCDETLCQTLLKSLKMLSDCSPLFKVSAKSLTVNINWDLHDLLSNRNYVVGHIKY